MVIEAIDPLQWVSKLKIGGEFVCLRTRLALGFFVQGGETCSFGSHIWPATEIPYADSYYYNATVAYAPDMQYIQFEHAYSWDRGDKVWETIIDVEGGLPVETTGWPEIPFNNSIPDWTVSNVGSTATKFVDGDYWPENTMTEEEYNAQFPGGDYSNSIFNPANVAWIKHNMGITQQSGSGLIEPGEAGLDNLPVPGFPNMTFANWQPVEVFIKNYACSDIQCIRIFQPGNNHQAKFAPLGGVIELIVATVDFSMVEVRYGDFIHIPYGFQIAISGGFRYIFLLFKLDRPVPPT